MSVLSAHWTAYLSVQMLEASLFTDAVKDQSNLIGLLAINVKFDD